MEQLLPKGESSLMTMPPIASRPEMPTKTYAIDFEHGRVVGFIDRNEAVRQAISKILRTWLGRHLAYNRRYGFYMDRLIGYETGYVTSEIDRRIKDALFADGRITGIGIITFEQGEEADALSVSFAVKTIFGSFDMQEKVRYTA